METSQPTQTTPERLERADVVEQRTGLKKSERARRIKLGTFPRPVSIGARAVAWKSSDIDAWIASRRPKDEA